MSGEAPLSRRSGKTIAEMVAHSLRRASVLLPGAGIPMAIAAGARTHVRCLIDLAAGAVVLFVAGAVIERFR